MLFRYVPEMFSVATGEAIKVSSYWIELNGGNVCQINDYYAEQKQANESKLHIFTAKPKTTHDTVNIKLTLMTVSLINLHCCLS